MFNFKKYPELIPYHKKYVKMNKKLSHLVYLSVDKYKESASIEATKLYEEFREFEKEYGQKIYELLKDVKPKFFNRRTKEYESWDEVIGVIATGDNIYRCLICATEEAGGLHRFPPEYYDPDLTDKTL